MLMFFFLFYKTLSAICALLCGPPGQAGAASHRGLKNRPGPGESSRIPPRRSRRESARSLTFSQEHVRCLDIDMLLLQTITACTLISKYNKTYCQLLNICPFITYRNQAPAVKIVTVVESFLNIPTSHDLDIKQHTQSSLYLAT